MQLNELIDDVTGAALLRDKSQWVEDFKYNDDGYQNLIDELQREIDESGIYKTFLEGETQDPPDGTTVQESIAAILTPETL